MIATASRKLIMKLENPLFKKLFCTYGTGDLSGSPGSSAGSVEALSRPVATSLRFQADFLLIHEPLLSGFEKVQQPRSLKYKVTRKETHEVFALRIDVELVVR